MSTPSTDRVVANARIGPDDSPHEAATHVWAQVVANHAVDPDGPLPQLGVLDRVVLYLRDVVGLSDATVATVLNTSEEAARRAHGHARSRIGLPQPAGDECTGWADVRADSRPGDPAVLAALVAHARDCPHCSGAVRETQHRLHPWWAPRTAAAAARRGAPAAVPAFVGTLGAVAAVVTSAVALGAGVAPLPEPPLPQPVVVDGDPGLPSDEEPPEGWPSPPASGAPVVSDGGSGDPGEPPGRPSDLVDELTDTVEDATDPVTDPLPDVVESVTDTAEDTLDEVTGTAEDLVDETTDAADDLIDDAGDITQDAVDDAAGTLDELP